MGENRRIRIYATLLLTTSEADELSSPIEKQNETNFILNVNLGIIETTEIIEEIGIK